MVRVVRHDRGDATVRLRLDRTGLLGVRVLSHQRHDAPGEVRTPELRLSNRDDVTTSGANRKENLGLRVEVFSAVKTARLRGNQRGVLATGAAFDRLPPR